MGWFVCLHSDFGGLFFELILTLWCSREEESKEGEGSSRSRGSQAAAMAAHGKKEKKEKKEKKSKVRLLVQPLVACSYRVCVFSGRRRRRREEEREEGEEEGKTLSCVFRSLQNRLYIISYHFCALCESLVRFPFLLVSVHKPNANRHY